MRGSLELHIRELTPIPWAQSSLTLTNGVSLSWEPGLLPTSYRSDAAIFWIFAKKSMKYGFAGFASLSRTELIRSLWGLTIR